MARTDLSKSSASAALTYAVSGSAAPEEIAAFLALLAAKRETSAEIAGVASAMRDVMLPVALDGRVLDIVGTGGDGLGTVNISTCASVLAAACGCVVAKHGNRSVSSMCGSADVLECLGVEIGLGPVGVAECVKEAGIGFMYAPVFHPAMRFVGPVRKAMGVRTVMNIVGPLLNPAQAECGVIGVFDASLLEVMAGALVELGVQKAVVVCTGGLDEYGVTGVSEVVEVRGGVVGKRETYDASEMCGMRRCGIEELVGGGREENARIMRDVLEGRMEGTAIEDAVALNAGAGCYVYGLDGTIAKGVVRARKALRDGKAGAVLGKWIQASERAAHKHGES